MPGLNYSAPLVGAGASASTDFAAANANTGINFNGSARFKRGFQAEIGIEAFANASASLTKFIQASVEGTAFARAKAGIQYQLPLNLFKEFGFIAKAEAIAEAAAGIKVGLGISIGDFIKLARENPQTAGLALDLLIIFLEEVSIGGEFSVNVSVSAKAHASISISGRVIPVNGMKPGFFYTMSAGAGLLKGVGKALSVGAEFNQFRRFYGRAADKCVNTAIANIDSLLPASLDHLKPVLAAFSPVAKIALRCAFEIGVKVANTNVAGTGAQAQDVCNEAVKVILEEVQRYVYSQLADMALSEIKKTLQQDPAITQAAWDNAFAERHQLSAHLMQMPDEPFQPIPFNYTYWQNLITKSVSVCTALYGGSSSTNPLFTESLSIIYSASELLLEAQNAKINTASAYAGTIASGSVQATTQAFQGPLSNQPDQSIRKFINSKNGDSPNHVPAYDDLLKFLIDDLILTRFLTAVPAVQEFMTQFKTDFNTAEKDLLKTMLRHSSAFFDTGGGTIDAKKTLELIVLSLDKFLTDKFKAQVLPQIQSQIDDPVLRLYIEEVLFPAVVYAKDLGLRTLLNWQQSPPDKDDFTEALAGIMLLLLGRTAVIVGDTFFTHVQQQIKTECDTLAAKVENNHPDVRPITQIFSDPDLKRLIIDCLKIGGEVLGPLPADTRGRLRQLLYQVFEPLPPGGESTFLESLADDFFIPNTAQMSSLADELTGIAKYRFVLFAEKFVAAIGNLILEKLEELILFAIDLVVNWEKHLAKALSDVAKQLKDLEKTIRRLNAGLIAEMIKARQALHQLFNELDSSTLRNRIKTDIKNKFVDKVFSALDDNDVYKSIPSEFRSGARNLVNGTVDGLLNNPVINPVFDAIGNISMTLDSLLPDVRELKPEDNLPEALMGLIIEKIEDNIRDHFGSTKPHINVSIPFSYTIWYIGLDLNWHSSTHHVNIPLGRIEVNMGTFLDIIRDGIEALNFYHDKLDAACFRLADALAKELELAAAKLDNEKAVANKNRLSKIDEDHNNQPKEICILNPVSLSHHHADVDIKIHLGGVAPSCLGLNKDEAQRVFIYLNGTMIPPKSLLVEENTAPKKADVHVKDYDFTGLKGYNPVTGTVHNTKTSLILNTGMLVPAQQKNNMIKTEPLHYTLGSPAYRELPETKAVMNVASAKSGRALYHSRTLKGKDDKGRPVYEHKLENTLPGRINTGSRINDTLENLSPGILLTFRADIDELVEGVNVLTVVMIDKGGERHQQSVNFTAKALPPEKKPVAKGTKVKKAILMPGTAKKKKVKAAFIPPVSFTITYKKKVKGKQVEKTETIPSLLPATAATLKRRKEEAMKYLLEQDHLNFSSQKK